MVGGIFYWYYKSYFTAGWPSSALFPFCGSLNQPKKDALLVCELPGKTRGLFFRAPKPGTEEGSTAAAPLGADFGHELH